MFSLCLCSDWKKLKPFSMEASYLKLAVGTKIAIRIEEKKTIHRALFEIRKDDNAESVELKPLLISGCDATPPSHVFVEQQFHRRNSSHNKPNQCKIIISFK